MISKEEQSLINQKEAVMLPLSLKNISRNFDFFINEINNGQLIRAIHSGFLSGSTSYKDESGKTLTSTDVKLLAQNKESKSYYIDFPGKQLVECEYDPGSMFIVSVVKVVNFGGLNV